MRAQVVGLDTLKEYASSEGSGETARNHRLVQVLAAHLYDKYQVAIN